MRCGPLRYDDVGQAAQTIAAALRKNNCPFERIEKIVPSMEDVFVSLIEARDRLEQPQQEVRR